MTNKLVISYRRDDTAGYAGRICDRLRAEFDVFIDVDNISLGRKFFDRLREAVANCHLLLPIIGPDWLDARDEKGNRRLANRRDYVRFEIATALQRGIPLIPILVDKAIFPKAEQLPADMRELVDYNGLFVRHDSFVGDMNRLVRDIKALDLPFRWAASHQDRYDTVGIVEPGQFVVVLAQPILRGTEVLQKGRVTRKRD
jgi:hypothetical protein